MHCLVILLTLLGIHQVPAAPTAPARLTLAEAVSRAMVGSPAIAAARHRVDAARAEVGMARGMLNIHVTGGVVAGASRDDTMTDAAAADPAPGAMLGRRASVHLAAAAMAPISTGGALEAQLRRAQAMLSMAEAELADERARTAAEVKEAYLRNRYALAMLAVAQADRDAARAMAENSRADWESGRGIEATYLRSVARLRSAELDVALAEAERASSGVMLARAMGMEAGAAGEASEDPEMAQTIASLDDALRAARTESPMIHAVQRRLDAANHGLHAAAAARRPQVYASLMGSIFTPRAMAGNGAATFALTAAMPILDGGVRKSAQARAEAETRTAAEDLRAAVLDVEAQLRTAWSDLVAAEASLAASRAAAEAARAAYAVVELRVRNQKSILVEQLDALAAVREAEAAEARARLDHGLAVAKIQRLVGKE